MFFSAQASVSTSTHMHMHARTHTYMQTHPTHSMGTHTFALLDPRHSASGLPEWKALPRSLAFPTLKKSLPYTSRAEANLAEPPLRAALY